MKIKPVEFQTGDQHVASGVEETARGCVCERWSGGEVVVALLLAALFFMGGIGVGILVANL